MALDDKPPRTRLGDYLGDQEGPCAAMWPALVDAVYRDGPRSANLAHLSEPARHLYLVGVLQGEVIGGGLSTFFSNSSGNHVPETFAALGALGAEAVHGILERALAPFDGAMPPRDRERRCEQLFAYEEREPNVLLNLDDEIDDLQRDLEDRKARYVKEHADAPLLADPA